ncbi:uncharacterized protein LOC117303538 isoform X1 [Asterias rubens]|uniref:uncharacterized protein LOC117303538 isoform X1 n=1 Tax=Asterias rubens TaxID=7604 RepID=UPI0014555366|nr:uncharacterized protein LOC117303538 isoform X1 [Asterias rubens]
MEGEDGDLVAAAIMAMQTDVDPGDETTILQVVTQSECAGDEQVGNQIMVHSSDGEIIVHEHSAALQQHLQEVQQLQHHHHHHHHQQQQPNDQQQHQHQSLHPSGTVALNESSMTIDTTSMGVDLQEVNVIEMPLAQSSQQVETSVVHDQQGFTKRVFPVSVTQATPLEIATEVPEVDVSGIDENVSKLCLQFLNDVEEVDGNYLRGSHEGPGISFEEFLSKYFCITGTSFVAVSNRSRTMPLTGQQRQSRYYGNCEGRIRWEAKGGTLPIEFCGYPFKIESSMYLHCLHGPKRDLRPKEPKPPKVSRRGRPRSALNRKLECPAVIQVREISVYTNEGYFVDKKEFKNSSKLRWEKQRILKKIRDDEGNGKEVTTTRRLYIKMPYVRVHSSLHPVGENSAANQTMDQRVLQKLKQLISNNVTNINEIKKCLKVYVDDVLFKHNPIEKKPKPFNRKFYPSPSDVQRQIAASLSTKSENTDMLAQNVKAWQARGTGKFFYRSHQSGSEESFLFVQQERWQQRLLERYGSDLVILDATSKSNTILTMATPLYCLCIHTNVNYIVVAVFLVEKETVANIKEALGVIQSWNTWWNPSSFMVDKCNIEVAAVKELFPNVRIYISDYHRKQSLNRWVSRKECGLDSDQQKRVLAMFDRIALEQNNTLYQSAKKEFMSDETVAENIEFLDYLQSEWFSCPETWAHGFRDYAIDNLINVNNGELAMDRFFRYSTIPKSRDKGVLGIVTLIVESYIPDAFHKYRKKNAAWKYTKFPTAVQNVPEYLRERPSHFVRECLKNQEDAVTYNNVDVQLMDPTHGVFHVRSKKGFHITSFLGPSCTCNMWKKFRFPCKHFFAIFLHFYEWGFHRLPELYINSVFLTRDIGVLQDPNAEAARVSQEYTPLEIQVMIPGGPEPCSTETVVSTAETVSSFNPITSNPVNLISIPELEDPSAKSAETVPAEVEVDPLLDGKQRNIVNIFKRGMDLINDISDQELISETEQVLTLMVTKLQRRVVHNHYMQSALPSIKRLKPNPPQEPQQLPQVDPNQQQEQVTIDCVTSSYW